MGRGRSVLRALRLSHHRHPAGHSRVERLFPQLLRPSCAAYLSPLLPGTHRRPGHRVGSSLRGAEPVPSGRRGSPLVLPYATNWLAVFKGAPSWNFLWHFWSLAIEEQFYFLWPIGVLLLGPRGVRYAAILGAPVCLLARLVWYRSSGPVDGLVFSPTHMDGLLIGALCASLFRDPRALGAVRRLLPVIASGALGLFVLAALTMNSELDYDAFCRTAAYTPLALGFGAVVLMCACSGSETTLLQRALRNRALTQTGAYAYGIYIFHPLVVFPVRIWLFHPDSPATWMAYVAVTWVLTFLIAALSYELVESRILRYKRYFEAGPRRAARIAEPGLAPAD